jgi:hypothetical protein
MNQELVDKLYAYTHNCVLVSRILNEYMSYINIWYEKYGFRSEISLEQLVGRTVTSFSDICNTIYDTDYPTHNLQTVDTLFTYLCQRDIEYLNMLQIFFQFIFDINSNNYHSLNDVFYNGIFKMDKVKEFMSHIIGG